jgi:hypothetical protein
MALERRRKVQDDHRAPDTRAAASDLLGLAAIAITVALAVSLLLSAGVLLIAGAAPEAPSVKSDFTLRPPAPG